MKIFLQVEGDNLQELQERVASRGNPLLFSRLRSAPKSLPKKERSEYIKQHGKDAWSAAVRSGRKKPATLQEWKEVNWGGKMIGKASCLETREGLQYTFEADGYPFPLLQYLSEEYPSLRFLLLGSQEGHVCLDILEDGRVLEHIDRHSPLQEIARINREEKLDEHLQSFLRTEAHVIRGTERELRSGKEVLLKIENGQKLSLQRESFRYPLRGDLLLREEAYLDDVLLPEIDGLRVLVDLYW